MHSAITILVLAVSSCAAHYPGLDTRDVLGEEAVEEGSLVECPVCNAISSLPSYEECPIVLGNKKYKRCFRGTYVNEMCGNRLDCYRGPSERCTEKMNEDVYGQRCAHGYYCHDDIHVCVGSDYAVATYEYPVHHASRYALHAFSHDRPDVRPLILA